MGSTKFLLPACVQHKIGGRLVFRGQGTQGPLDPLEGATHLWRRGG